MAIVIQGGVFLHWSELGVFRDHFPRASRVNNLMGDSILLIGERNVCGLLLFEIEDLSIVLYLRRFTLDSFEQGTGSLMLWLLDLVLLEQL